jgi:chromosome partitioning protein
MNITVLAKKGGVGKSTLSLLLYEAFRQAGKSAAIRDWDAQGTSSKAMELISALDDPSKPDASAKSAKPEILIYDTPPNLEHNATATAVRASDIVLVVTSPSPADIWEADEAVRFAKAKNPAAKIRVIFNKVRKATVLGRLVDESAKQLSVPVLSATLSARECYQHAVASGWKALDSAARQEILQVIVALLSQP